MWSPSRKELDKLSKSKADLALPRSNQVPSSHGPEQLRKEMMVGGRGGAAGGGPRVCAPICETQGQGKQTHNIYSNSPWTVGKAVWNSHNWLVQHHTSTLFFFSFKVKMFSFCLWATTSYRVLLLALPYYQFPDLSPSYITPICHCTY